ncbi:serine/threonine protein kinase, partial [bacterium]
MTIKDYEIIKQIGSGGMGAIYLARDPRLDRLVAIKKTRIPGNLEKDVHNEIIQRFYREARAVANLNHPNIVTVYDLGEDDINNECFMVMEYLEGRPVDSLIDEQKRLSINLAMKIGIQTCEALSYLHQKNIIHRDIKPANLMYCNNGMVKLMDFGLVRIDDNLDLTRAGTLLGSVLYMSPEQIKNPKNIDHQVDIYAFGVSMYQMMSGHFPYDGESVWEVIRKVTMEDPIPLSKVNPEIPFVIEKAIMKAIAKYLQFRG